MAEENQPTKRHKSSDTHTEHDTTQASPIGDDLDPQFLIPIGEEEYKQEPDTSRQGGHPGRRQQVQRGQGSVKRRTDDPSWVGLQHPVGPRSTPTPLQHHPQPHRSRRHTATIVSHPACACQPEPLTTQVHTDPYFTNISPSRRR